MLERTFELQTNQQCLCSFREQLKTVLSQTSMPEKRIHEVVLAVDEALANISRHGYRDREGRVEVSFKDSDNKIEIIIRDYGEFFDLTKVPPPELPPKKPGGLGIYFIRTVMDKVEYHAGAGGCNELCLVKSKG